MKKISVYFVVMGLMVMLASIVWATDPCIDRCPNTNPGFINYCAPGAQPGTCSCTEFDYESGQGYCPGTFVHPQGVTMKLCDCTGVQDIDPANDYSLQVKILTPGVYWAPMNPSVAATPIDAAIEVTSYQTAQLLCNDIDGISNLTTVCRFYDDNDVLVSGTNDICAIGSGATGYNLSVTNCALSGDGATTFCTQPAKLFEALRSFITIDIPAMYYDNTIVSLGTEVKIAVFIKSSKGVCMNCETKCECSSILIGTFGCHKSKCDLYFSYVIVNDPIWWSGITITYKTDYVGTAIFTFYDQFGNVAKTVIEVASRELIVDMADAILAKSTGDTLDVSKPIQFYVSTDFDSEGMCILGDSTTGGVHGYKAANTCCSCIY